MQVGYPRRDRRRTGRRLRARAPSFTVPAWEGAHRRLRHPASHGRRVTPTATSSATISGSGSCCRSSTGPGPDRVVHGGGELVGILDGRMVIHILAGREENTRSGRARHRPPPPSAPRLSRVPNVGSDSPVHDPSPSLAGSTRSPRPLAAAARTGGRGPLCVVAAIVGGVHTGFPSNWVLGVPALVRQPRQLGHRPRELELLPPPRSSAASGASSTAPRTRWSSSSTG